jgi:hypothetical protein
MAWDRQVWVMEGKRGRQQRAFRYAVYPVNLQGTMQFYHFRGTHKASTVLTTTTVFPRKTFHYL